MNKPSRLVLLVLLLLVLPIGLRLAWFYRGTYTPLEYQEVDGSSLVAPHEDFQTYEDEPIDSSGIVIFDLSHTNNIRSDDLTALHDRLTNRGVTVKIVTESGDSPDVYLRDASALVVAAPTEEYTEDELSAIAAFVDAGGRLLLVADPTRTADFDIGDDLFLAVFPNSAVPAMNSIANAFGIVYYDDYIYNLVDNQGNYRNVKFTDFNSDQDLTEGLDTVVFFASHSIRSDGIPILIGDENTRSPVRFGETELSPTALTNDGNVLALGDINFLIPPFHTIANNDHFLSNIANWLATAERDWDLRDFPFLFESSVDLIPLTEGRIDPQLLIQTDTLVSIFDSAGLSLNLTNDVETENDALMLGVFADADLIEDYLSSADVSVLEGEDEDDSGNIEIEGVGTIGIEGTTLFLEDRNGDQTVVIALGEDAEAVVSALERLVSNDFSDCFDINNLIICSTGEHQEGIDEEGESVSFLASCDQPPNEVTAEEPPRIGSISESQEAWDAFVYSLEFFACEPGEEGDFEPGEITVYNIIMQESEDVLWYWGWCTATEEDLEENWDVISLEFILNGEVESLSGFAIDESGTCLLYYALVTDWPPGTHLLTTQITFLSDLNDGFSDYEAGIRTIEYWVTVED